MSDKKHSRIGVIVAIVGSVLIFGFAGWLLLNRQYVMDQVSVWAYEAPAPIEAIEEEVGFSDEGRFYFRSTHPVVANADEFNRSCPRQEVGSPILGCYASGRIYIYDIDNPQLEGLEEVTAAHEMLHAVWERMSPGEQKKIGTLLRTEYAKLVDGDLKERMDYYARTEPGQFENELHSIIGTEMSPISPELERYYAKFFDDRKKVLALHEAYDSVFSGLRKQSETLYQELVTIGSDIEARTLRYNADIVQLSHDIDDFNRRATNGQFSSMAQFNAERAALVSRTGQLEAERSAINQAIATYNDKYAAYESLAIQIEALNQSIDSFKSLEPAPSL